MKHLAIHFFLFFLFVESSFCSIQSKLFKSNSALTPDTLQIFVLYTEFQKEEPNDVSTSTGKGTFNSKADDKFTLDPVGAREYSFYLEKHLEFAKNYFEEISNHRLVLTWEIFPKPNSTGKIETPYVLSEKMSYYNPVRSKSEKNAVFQERRAEAIMKFVAETIRIVDSKKGPENNPFEIPKSPSKNKHRAYLIFHAGHNGLIDGGGLGQLGADTPNDIIDFFATEGDFKALNKLKSDSTKLLQAQKKDSLGVVVGSTTTRDTISEIMLLSESASQDKVNFGLNGILVNQIARQIGLPDTWDRGTGFTQLGYFDLMDVGHLSMLGYVPVYPSAWLRQYMGWEEPLVARPGNNGTFEIKLWSPAIKGQNHSVKIPISEKEYLLVENRQRSVGDSLWIHFSKQRNKDDVAFSLQDSIKIPVKFLDSLLLDSICNQNGKNCQKNKNRPEGIITKVSSFDMGIPGSGLLVWHVNEWFIEETIKNGLVNFSTPESKQLSGLRLVEADGNNTIGVEGKNGAGQSFFDFGSAADVFPHIQKKVKKTEPDTLWQLDTIRYIHPFSISSTGSWNDGKTHIVLEAVIPQAVKEARFLNPVTGDSVINFPDSSIQLKVHFNLLSGIKKEPNWNWPIQSLTSEKPNSFLPLFLNGSNYLISSSADEKILAYQSNGSPYHTRTDTSYLENSYDSLKTLLPNGRTNDSLAIIYSELKGDVPSGGALAKLSDSVFVSLSKQGQLSRISLNPAQLVDSTQIGAEVKTLSNQGGLLGPMVLGQQVLIISKNSELIVYDQNGTEVQKIVLPSASYTALAGFKETENSDWSVLAVGSRGEFTKVSLQTQTAVLAVKPWTSNPQKFYLVSSDFNRNGKGDVFLVGSQGDLSLFEYSEGAFSQVAGYPVKINREAPLLDTNNNLITLASNDDAPLVQDLNEDGFPDLIFTIPNGITAIDYRGQPLKNWPFQFDKRQSVGLGYTSTKYPATKVGSSPIGMSFKNSPILLIPSPDGKIVAITSDGKPLEYSSYSPNEEYARYSAKPRLDIRDWPIVMGGYSFDSTRNPYFHLSALSDSESQGIYLFAKSNTGYIDAWKIPEMKVLKNSWTTWGGNENRNFYFSVEGLKSVEITNSEKILDFHVFPAPLRNRFATIHLEIGAPAKKAVFKVFDLAGQKVYEITHTNFPYAMASQDKTLDLGNLGADVYTILCEVTFESGKVGKKWFRLGVIR